ncbi:MAG: hypothetical protein CMJ64_00810 [Planctomycetaceae bacterium]|nr:hypothetical protein [Planctomycetaceae bacterium]
MLQFKRFQALWEIIVVLTTLVVGGVLPYRLGIGLELDGPWQTRSLLVTLVFGLDFVIHLWDRLRQRGDRPTAVVSWATLRLFADLVAALPYSLLLGAVGPSLELLRLVKFLRVQAILSRWKQVSSFNPSLLRLTSFAFWIAVFSHWMACGWIGLGGVEQRGAPMSQHIEGLYWCITTLTTVGYGDVTPKTDVQRIYTMFAMIVGVGSYGFIIGNVASLLSNIDVARSRFLDKMEKIDAYLRYKSIPRNLRDRVQNYYQYLWDSRLAHDDFEVAGDLIDSLRTEIMMHISRPLVERVPFFKHASDEFMRSIVPHLQPKVFLPGDHIFKQGDVGDAMYFLTRGQVEVVLEESGRQLAVLAESAYFGEIAVLKEVPRTASVRAIDHCQVYELKRDSVNQLMQAHPDFAQHVLEALDSYEDT